MSDDIKKKKKKKNKESSSTGVVKKKKLDLEVPTKKKKKSKSSDVIVDVSGGDTEGKTVVAKVKSDRVLIDVAKDDYIIVRVGKKNQLALAHSPKRNTCYIESTLHSDEPQTFEYDEHTLIANIGKDPVPGAAFGVQITLHYGEVATDLGPMHYFRKTDDDEKKAIKIAIKKVVAKMNDIGLSKVLPIKRIEVHNPKGKWAGSYQVSFKSGSAEDIIKLHPKILNEQLYNQYIFMHELGHAIWYRYVDEKMRSEWLQLYNEQTKVTKAKKSEMEDLCTSLVSSQLSVREFQADIEGDEQAMFKDALAYLKKIHKMTPEDLNILLNQNSKALHNIWPTSAAVSHSDSLCGEYSKVSVQELFAEAFAKDATGEQIPKTCKKLLEKTLKKAQAAE